MITREFPWFTDWWQQASSLRERPATATLVCAPPAMRVDQFAMELAAADLCQSPLADGSACGQCASCGWVKDLQHPDFRWLRPEADMPDDAGDSSAAESAGGGAGAGAGDAEASEGGAGATGKKASRVLRIEQIRSLLGFSQVSSHRGGSRWALVGPVEALHFAAANALLKGLEEPNPSMRFVLYGERLAGVPATILSRCRRVTLTAEAGLMTAQRLASAQAQDWLLPLLRQGAVQPSAWAQKAGKTHPQEVLDLLGLWLLDVSRVQYGIAPVSFPQETKALKDQAQPIARHPQGSQMMARGIAQMLDHSRMADHPLNPQLFYETIFEDLRRALGEAPSL